MRPSPITLLTLMVATPITAAHLAPRAGNCPAVWKDVVVELKEAFKDCTPLAHKAVRLPFHDCINNGCDASIILAPGECSRPENAGLEEICQKIGEWKDKYKVGAADMVQFAGAVAISACPLGPKVKAFVGRTDSATAPPEHSVPSSRDSVSKILGAFAAKGFSAKDVVALLGTHSIAVQFHDDPSKAGTALDSTPNTFDIKFFKETQKGTAPYSLQSDTLMAHDNQTKSTWAEFADGTGKWKTAFVDAWDRFAVIGNDVSKLQDCSSLVPETTASQKRQIQNMKFTQMLSAKFRI